MPATPSKSLPTASRASASDEEHEEHLARLLCRALDRSVDTVDDAVAGRLRAARRRALEHHGTVAHRACVPGAPQIVGAGGTARGDGDGRFPFGHTLLVLASLLLVCVGMFHWNQQQQAGRFEAIDSALLSDELSPNAYLDPGFQAWLSHYAQHSSLD